MDLSWLLAREKRQNEKSRLQSTFVVEPHQICVFEVCAYVFLPIVSSFTLYLETK